MKNRFGNARPLIGPSTGASAVVVSILFLLVGIGVSSFAGAKPFAPTNAQAAELSLVNGKVVTQNQAVSPAAPVGSGFTYQGQLKAGGVVANGQYDFVFSLFDALTDGTLVGTPLTLTDQVVTSGLFTELLDFGPAAFDGSARYLEIEVRPAGQGSYVVLTPRQAITPAPYALFALKTQPYGGVIVVAKSGGDFTSITAALDSITDNSADHAYLIYVAPGVYAETVAMKPYVDIEGAGENNTTISHVNIGSTPTLYGASNSELRHITIENKNGTGNQYAIVNINASPRLTYVTVNLSGNDVVSSHYAVYNRSASAPYMSNMKIYSSGGNTAAAVFNEDSSPTLDNVVASATGGTSNNAVYDIASSPIIRNSSLSASGSSHSYGIYTSGFQPDFATVDNSTITASSFTIFSSTSNQVKVGASRLNGGPVLGPPICAGVYDENYVFYANTCP